MIPPLLVSIFNLFVGSIFVLSAYVVYRNISRTIKYKEKLLPLHVWTITISYLTMCGSFLYAQTDNPIIFYVRFAAIFLGVYALWTLVMHYKQDKHTHH